MTRLSAGDPAPQFEMTADDGSTVSSESLAGSRYVLYFYPKDDTPGCTTEACNFRDNIFAFRKLGAEILGISVDDVESHRAFAEKHGLPFTLLADDGGQVAETYGVLRNLGVMKIANRETFVIAPDGTIARHYEDVDPDEHSAQVLADLETLTEKG